MAEVRKRKKANNRVTTGKDGDDEFATKRTDALINTDMTARTKLGLADNVILKSTKEKRKPNNHSNFHLDLWLMLCVNNWVLDFGRPIAALFVPLTLTPLNYPSVGDYFHMLYNVITPFILLQLLMRGSHLISSSLSFLLLLIMTMGSSIHLVGDSVNHRLIHAGYEMHRSVRDNQIMKDLKPQLVDLFELLYKYDEEIGHLLWYIPFFTVIIIYFYNSFLEKKSKISRTLPLSAWILLPFNALYFWYLVTEGQIFPLFLFVYFCMISLIQKQRSKKEYMDVNAIYLFLSMTITLILVAVWSICLWNDEILRQKYRTQLLYVPEPWSYYTLYHYKSEH